MLICKYNLHSIQIMTENKTRFFKLLSVPNTLKQFVENTNGDPFFKDLSIYMSLPTMRFSGKTLNDAAYLAFCRFIGDMEEFDISLSGKLEFSLIESTRGSDYNVYNFTGFIENVENYKVNVNCGTCVACSYKTEKASHKYINLCDNNRFVSYNKLFIIQNTDTDETTSYLVAN